MREQSHALLDAGMPIRLRRWRLGVIARVCLLWVRTAVVLVARVDGAHLDSSQLARGAAGEILQTFPDTSNARVHLPGCVDDRRSEHPYGEGQCIKRSSSAQVVVFRVRGEVPVPLDPLIFPAPSEGNARHYISAAVTISGSALCGEQAAARRALSPILCAKSMENSSKRSELALTA